MQFESLFQNIIDSWNISELLGVTKSVKAKNNIEFKIGYLGILF